MKALILGTTVLVMCVAALAAEPRTWTGTIADKMCGSDHKKMGGKLADRDCTLACAKGGSPYVLVSDGTVYELKNHDADLRTHAGHVVKLTGELQGEAIRVEKVEVAPPK